MRTWLIIFAHGSSVFGWRHSCHMERWDQVFQKSPTETWVRWGCLNQATGVQEEFGSCWKIERLLWSSYSSIKLKNSMTPGGNCSDRLWNCRIFTYPHINDISSRRCQQMYQFMNIGHFVIVAFHLAKISADRHLVFCHLMLFYQRLLTSVLV